MGFEGWQRVRRSVGSERAVVATRDQRDWRRRRSEDRQIASQRNEREAGLQWIRRAGPQTRDRSGIAWKPSNVRSKLFAKTTGYGRARYQDSEEVIFCYVASPVISLLLFVY